MNTWLFHGKRRLVYSVLGLLMTAVLAGTSAGVPQARADATTGRIGTVQYVSSQGEDGGVETVISYPHQSRADLDQYVSTNRTLLAQLAQSPSVSVAATVVFRRPVDPTDLPVLATTYRLNISSYVMRAVSPDGQRITIFGAPEGSALVPQNLLQQAVSSVQQHDAGAQLLGVVTVDATINASDALRIAQDSRVFLVDVTADAVRRKVQGQYGNSTRVRVDNPTQLYWFLENANMVSDRP